MTDVPGPGPTLAALAEALDAGQLSARALMETCLARIDDPQGEGARAFVALDRDRVRAAADAMDALRQAGATPSRFAGIPVAIKDLFDVRGEVTRAGSTVLGGSEPAREDAPAVARLRRMGFVLLGRTNMTEFAYSGLGINPHHGTPRSPWRRQEGRIPGGSSSGSAVAVADEMAPAALGTDTGGSCRIPAAFTGTVGYKPTARRVPTMGAVPLSTSLDSIGPFGRSVACCATLDAILAGENPAALVPADLRGLRLALPTTNVLDGLDEAVGAAFEAALAAVEAAGATVSRTEMPEFAEIVAINATGILTSAESFAWHRRLLATHREGYDRRIALGILRGESQSAADYIDVLSARIRMIAAFADRMARFDALVMPTVPIVPPRIDALVDDDEAYTRTNLLVLRNPRIVNVLDGCAISLPIHRPGEAPVGLSVASIAGADARVFAIAAAIEAILAPGRRS